MKIYTTYFAKLNKLPKDIVVIPISNGIPKYLDSSLSGMKYKKLIPPWYIVKDYQEDKDEAKYTARYKELILNHLDPTVVCAELERMSQGKDVALVCYEKSGDFCHRHIVSEWMREAGYDVWGWIE